MYYSTYRWVVVGSLSALWVLTAVVTFVTLPPAFATLLTLGLVPVFLVWGALDFYFVNSRLIAYDGRIPMWGVWALGGDDLVDDRRPEAVASYEQALREMTQPDFDSNELEPPGTAHCPFCHAALGRDDAKYCDECGKPIPRASGPRGTPGSVG